MAAAEAVGWSGRVGSGKKGLRIDICIVSAGEGRKEGKGDGEGEGEERKGRWFDYLILLCLRDGGRENRCCVLFCVDLAWKKI